MDANTVGIIVCVVIIIAGTIGLIACAVWPRERSYPEIDIEHYRSLDAHKDIEQETETLSNVEYIWPVENRRERADGWNGTSKRVSALDDVRGWLNQ